MSGTFIAANICAIIVGRNSRLREWTNTVEACDFFQFVIDNIFFVCYYLITSVFEHIKCDIVLHIHQFTD